MASDAPPAAPVPKFTVSDVDSAKEPGVSLEAPPSKGYVPGTRRGRWLSKLDSIVDATILTTRKPQNSLHRVSCSPDIFARLLERGTRILCQCYEKSFCGSIERVLVVFDRMQLRKYLASVASALCKCEVLATPATPDTVALILPQSTDRRKQSVLDSPGHDPLCITLYAGVRPCLLLCRLGGARAVQPRNPPLQDQASVSQSILLGGRCIQC